MKEKLKSIRMFFHAIVCIGTLIAWGRSSEASSLIVVSIFILILLGNIVSRMSLRFGWTSFAADYVVVSFIVYATGGPHSPLLFLYLITTSLVGANTSRDNSIAASFFGITLHYSVSYAQLHGILLGVKVLEPPGGLILQSTGLFSGMLLVGILSSYLVLNLEKKTQALIEQTERAKEFLDKFPDPILTIDREGVILGGNSAFEKIFPEYEKKLSVKKIFSPHTLEEIISLSPQISAHEKEFLISARTLNDKEGSLEGYTLILQDITELKRVKNTILEHEEFAKRLSKDHPDSRDSILPEFLGETPVMNQVFKLIKKVATTDSTVLVLGESGTGKELVAKGIHSQSERRDKPFIAVNCGAIPSELLESEFFGHKKGAFTGAVGDKDGFFVQAEHGTLFLDEVGELPLPMQAKLLRALQEKVIRPVGGNKEHHVTCRIIAATNRNLKSSVAEGVFREDLYYRLNVIQIPLPPLRERKEDLKILIPGILNKISHGKPTPTVTPLALEVLLSYGYPGNVRELENILERAYVLGGDIISPEHLPEHLTSPDPIIAKETKLHFLEDISLPASLDDILASLERKYLEAALMKADGGKKKASELLGINFRSIRYRLQKYGMSSHD